MLDCTNLGINQSDEKQEHQDVSADILSPVIIRQCCSLYSWGRAVLALSFSFLIFLVFDALVSALETSSTNLIKKPKLKKNKKYINIFFIFCFFFLFFLFDVTK